MLTYRGRTRMGSLNLLLFGLVPLGVSMACPLTPHPQSHSHHIRMNERVSVYFFAFEVETLLTLLSTSSYPKRSFSHTWPFTIPLQTRFRRVWSSRTSSFRIFTTTSATYCGLWYVERPSCAQTLRLTSLSCLRRVAPSCPFPRRPGNPRPRRPPTSTTCTLTSASLLIPSRILLTNTAPKHALSIHGTSPISSSPGIFARISFA